MKTKHILIALAISISGISIAQKENETGLDKHKYFVSSSAFMLVNLFPVKDPPRFYQLNIGYRLTAKDAISAEAITWQFHAPLGIPFGDSYENEEEFFPGIVRDYGIGLAYQRFIWKGWYSTFHATPLFQQYLNKDKTRIQSGFMLFLTARTGYHFEFFNNRFFLEPSIAFTHWPINTNMPESFQIEEDRWPNYFLFEPGLHFGFQF